jgi:hypothetical protein
MVFWDKYKGSIGFCLCCSAGSAEGATGDPLRLFEAPGVQGVQCRTNGGQNVVKKSQRRWRDRLKQPEGLPDYVARREAEMGALCAAMDRRRVAHRLDQERTEALELEAFGGSRVALEAHRLQVLEQAAAARSALLAEVLAEAGAVSDRRLFDRVRFGR